MLQASQSSGYRADTISTQLVSTRGSNATAGARARACACACVYGQFLLLALSLARSHTHTHTRALVAPCACGGWTKGPSSQARPRLHQTLPRPPRLLLLLLLLPRPAQPPRPRALRMWPRCRRRRLQARRCQRRAWGGPASFPSRLRAYGCCKTAVVRRRVYNTCRALCVCVCMRVPVRGGGPVWTSVNTRCIRTTHTAAVPPLHTGRERNTGTGTGTGTEALGDR
jgi:hypothetical protein